MAQPNIALKPFSGTDKESFRVFEHLLRSIIGVAAVAGAQQANFLQLHLRDAALRYFQTLPEATRNDLALSLTALRNHFCNPQLQELHVIKLENVRFDPKTDSPENFLVSLQNMTLKAYPDPIPEAYPPGADQAAQDAVDASNDENLRFAHQERQNQTKRFFKKCMPSWLRAKLLEQPDNTTVEDLCLLARKQLTIHDLCKKEDYIDGAFNEVSPTISDNLINALSKLSQTQESMENRMSALSKQVEEQNKRFDEQKFSQSQNFGNQLRGNGFRGSNRGQRGSYNNSNYRSRGNFRGYGRSRGYRDFNNFNNQFPFPAQNNFQYTPNAPQFAPTTPQNFQPIQEQQTASNGQPVVQVFQPIEETHVPVTQYAQIICHICGYPNHLATNCSMRSRGRRGGTNFPFQRSSKN